MYRQYEKPNTLKETLAHLKREYQIALENYIADLKLYISKKEDSQTADRMISPLVYYINTGRASTDFIKNLLNTKFYSIYTVLRKQETDYRIIQLLKKKVGIKL